MFRTSVLLVALAATVCSAQWFPSRPTSWDRRPTGPATQVPNLQVNTPDVDSLTTDYAWSNGHFGLNLYKQIAQITDNFAISPFSVHSALTMLLLGTAGRAKTEIIQTLHIRSPIHIGFKNYNESLDTNNENAILMVANAVYADRRLYVRQAYANKLRRFYDSQVNRFANTDPTVPINQWVAKKTRDMIQDLLVPDDIDQDTRMILLNAVYFKAKWNYIFHQSLTTLKAFTNINQQQTDVYMMTNRGQYQMLSSEQLGATVIRLPYTGDRYSLYVILPGADESISVVESRLTHQNLNDTLYSTWNQDKMVVNVQLPKFSLDTKAGMKNALNAMGIREIFNPNNDPSTFSWLTNRLGLYAKSVKHQCIIEVDEEGTEASAATADILYGRSGLIPQEFNANRPFIFVLRDDLKLINLFMGRYVDPQGDNLSE